MAASTRDRCTMPPCRSLSRSLVALEVELVHRTGGTSLWLIWQSLKWEVGADPGSGRDARGSWYLGTAFADLYAAN